MGPELIRARIQFVPKGFDLTSDSAWIRPTGHCYSMRRLGERQRELYHFEELLEQRDADPAVLASAYRAGV